MPYALLELIEVEYPDSVAGPASRDACERQQGLWLQTAWEKRILGHIEFHVKEASQDETSKHKETWNIWNSPADDGSLVEREVDENEPRNPRYASQVIKIGWGPGGRVLCRLWDNAINGECDGERNYPNGPE